jgi:hypothetical protein
VGSGLTRNYRFPSRSFRIVFRRVFISSLDFIHFFFQRSTNSIAMEKKDTIGNCSTEGFCVNAFKMGVESFKLIVQEANETTGISTPAKVIITLENFQS